MPVVIPENAKYLLERPIVVTLATTMPDNTPQLSPVWFNWDGEFILINTARGRAKDDNMTARPHVSILSVDPENPYRYLEVRGEIAEITEEGGVDHINFLSGRYTGNTDYYQGDTARQAAETRVIYKIRPTRVIARV